MERKQYLELCQKYAVGYNVKVKFNNFDYRPYRYELSFDNQGKCIHRAILKDRLIDGLTYEKIAEIYDMSYQQIRTIIYKEQEKIFKHI